MKVNVPANKQYEISGNNMDGGYCDGSGIEKRGCSVWSNLFVYIRKEVTFFVGKSIFFCRIVNIL